MRRVDLLDTRLAKHFGWCFAARGCTVDVREVERRIALAHEERAQQEVELDPISSIPSGDDEPPRTHDRSRSACRALAAAIAEAWEIREDEGSARATKRLLARADRLGVEIVGMDVAPIEAIRLVRLFVRHGSKMTRRQRERAAAVTMLLPIERAETADLLVEIARAGDRTIADAILADDDWAPGPAASEGLAVRLADVVDAGPTHACRAVAIDLLARTEPRDAAVSALRRALRLPSFAVRARSLHALATARRCAVSPDDLVTVLRDLVAHPPPGALRELRDEQREEDERTFADAVIAALMHVHPADAEEALLDLIDADHDTVWLDEAWATEALAVAFPETAAVMVDHWLKCTRAHERTRALGAIERLPNDLAEPRLRRAASDPAFAIRDVARRQWLERYGSLCGVQVEDIPGAALLTSPPSDTFLARLAVMHGRVRDARQTMARALLAEAPSREALVLVLQLVGDDADSSEPSFGARDEGWAVTLVQRFGPDAVEGLCMLAARFDEPESFGWMRRLGDLVERGFIAREHASPVQRLAAAHVASDEAGRLDDSLRILARLGAPPELFERILAVALDDDFGSPEARALICGWPDRVVDARLTSEMALALAERDWTRLRHAAGIALERGSPAARVIAGRVLEVAERDVDALDAAVECARHLRVAGVIDDGWALAAVEKTDSPIFAVAARVWRAEGPGPVRAALERALASPARAGASAAQAAIALLHGEPGLSPRDRRLPGVLAAAAPVDRAELIYAMCVHGAPLAVAAHHLQELMISPDPEVTRALVGIAVWLKSPKARALLRDVLPRVVDFELRADVEEALGTGPAPYWAEG
jgi:hypothetical protein